MQTLYLQNLAHYDSEDGVSEDYALNDTCRFIGEQSDIDGPRVRLEIDHILRHGELYSGGSTSKDFDELGRRINKQPSGEELSGTETTGNNNTDTGETTEKTKTTGSGTEPTKNKATAPVSKEAKRQAQIIEMGHQARNKLNMMMVKYKALESYLTPKDDYPYFECTDSQVIVLRMDLIDRSENWDNPMIALVCELVPFLTAYFEAKVEDFKAESAPKELYQLDEKALETCTESLRAEVAISTRAIDTIRYGFSSGDKTVEDVLAIQDDFYELGRLLRAYRWAVEESDG